jgi:hypothetical protein
MAIKRKFFAPPGIISNEASFVFSALDSTSITTGALQVIGGAGIGKTFNIGGNFNLWNGNFYTGFRSSASSNITYLLPQTTPATGTSVLQSDSSGILTWAPLVGSSIASTSSFSNLSISGNASVGQTLTVEDVIVNGTITTTFEPGDIIKMSAFDATDLSMVSVGVNSYSYTEIGSVTYTPKSSNSYLIFEFNVNYYIDSLTIAEDDFYSQITVDGTEISFSRQIFQNGEGGGTRSGVLFPLLARYTNSSTSSKIISIKAKRGNTDDALIIIANNVSGILRVTEVAR